MALLDEQLKLVNTALREIGHGGLSTLSPSATDQTEALIATRLDDWVEEVLKELPWRCVTKESTTLTAYADGQELKYDYAYRLPTDFVRFNGDIYHLGYPIRHDQRRAWEIIGRDASGTLIMGTWYLTPSFYYVYKDLTNEDFYSLAMDTTLREAIVKYIKKQVAVAVTENAALLERLEVAYEMFIRKAKGRNWALRWKGPVGPQSSILSVRDDYYA
jgi:hypothetical protein